MWWLAAFTTAGTPLHPASAFSKYSLFLRLLSRLVRIWLRGNRLLCRSGRGLGGGRGLRRWFCCSSCRGSGSGGLYSRADGRSFNIGRCGNCCLILRRSNHSSCGPCGLKSPHCSGVAGHLPTYLSSSPRLSLTFAALTTLSRADCRFGWLQGIAKQLKGKYF